MSPLQACTWICFGLLSAGFLLVMFRLLRGPTLPDRVVALDLAGTLVLGFIAVYMIHASQPLLLRVGIVLALLMFLGTTAFAYFIERRNRP